MSDPFSVAAGVVGVLRFTAQSAQGVLFLRDFVSDFKHAPDTTKDLGEKIKLVITTRQNIEDLCRDVVRQSPPASQSTPSSQSTLQAQPSLSTFHSPLEQSLQFVNNSIEALKKDIGKSATGGRWERAKFVTRKKALESHLAQLDRAMNQVQSVQVSILQSLQQHILSAIDKSTKALQTPISEITTTGNTLVASSQRNEEKLSSMLDRISQAMNEATQGFKQIANIETAANHLVIRSGHDEQILTTLSDRTQQGFEAVEALQAPVANIETAVTENANKSDLLIVRSEHAEQNFAKLSDRTQQGFKAVLALQLPIATINAGVSDTSGKTDLVLDLSQRTEQTVATLSSSMTRVQDDIAHLSNHTREPVMLSESSASTLMSNFQSMLAHEFDRHSELIHSGVRSSTRDNGIQANGQFQPPASVASQASWVSQSAVKSIYQYTTALSVFGIKIRRGKGHTVKIASTTEDDESGKGQTWVMDDTSSALEILFNIPFRGTRAALTVEYCKLQSQCQPRMNMQIRTYNIIPKNSPIIKACIRFDLDEVQRLFNSGLASPLDRAQNGVGKFQLPFMVVLSQYRRESFGCAPPSAKASRLLEFLLKSWDARDSDDASDTCFIISAIPDNCGPSHDILTQIWQKTLETSSENPFDSSILALLLAIRPSDDQLLQASKSQEYWSLEPFEEYTGHLFVEDVRQVLEDPDGLLMTAALDEGKRYKPVPDIGYIYEDLPPIFSLLRFAGVSQSQQVQKCCIIRLKTLLGHGNHPRDMWLPCDWDRFYELARSNIWNPKRYISVTGYAKFLGLEDIWVSALKAAEYTDYEIQDLLDEDQYFGVPALLDNSIPYMSRSECQYDFIVGLGSGQYLVIKGPENIFCMELAYNLGRSWRSMGKAIREAKRAFREYEVPGAWPAEGERILIPGIDFKVVKDIREWNCYEEAVTRLIKMKEGYSSDDGGDESTALADPTDLEGAEDVESVERRYATGE